MTNLAIYLADHYSMLSISRLDSHFSPILQAIYMDPLARSSTLTRRNYQRVVPRIRTIIAYPAVTFFPSLELLLIFQRVQ